MFISITPQLKHQVLNTNFKSYFVQLSQSEVQKLNTVLENRNVNSQNLPGE